MTTNAALCHCEERSDEAISLWHSSEIYEMLYQVVGEFFADLLVENKVIVEVKAVDKYISAFEAQLLNYLKATGVDVGLIVNFGPSVQVKRMVL